MSAKKWQSRSPVEKGLIIGASVIGSIFLIHVFGQINEMIAKRKIAKDYQKALNEYNKMIASGQLPAGTPPPQPPTITPTKIKNLADSIADKVIGWNIIYYPEIINQIVDLNNVEIMQLKDYWDKHYAPMSGGNLKSSLENEDAYIMQYGFSTHAYQPAIDKL